MDPIRILTSIYSWTLGTSLLAQLLQTFLLCWIVYAVLMGGKGILDAAATYSESTVMLLPKLYNSAKVINQDPNQQNSITIYPSTNAPSGLEFSYSCFLLLDNKNFQGSSKGLRHVFHKGSPVYKPLMCPGVFVRNNENSLVIYMNEAAHWDTYCEIPSIPVGKWMHLAIVVRNMNVDIYLNGNVAHRMTLSSIPRQNFGDIYVFKNEHFSDKQTAPPGKEIDVVGAASGFISRLQYTGYALNYEQIDRMVRQGPSTELDSSEINLPPYLTDSWWVTYYK
jgi:hypothetical protein